MAWKGKIQALNPYLTNALENVIGTCWTAYSPFSPSPSYHHHILSVVYYSCRQSAPILHSLLYSVQKWSGSHIHLVEKQSHSAARETSFTLRKSSKLTGKLMQQDREQRRERESAEAIGKYKKKFPISASGVNAFGRGLQFHRSFPYHIPLTHHTFTKRKRLKISRGPTEVSNGLHLTTPGSLTCMKKAVLQPLFSFW